MKKMKVSITNFVANGIRPDYFLALDKKQAGNLTSDLCRI